MQQQVGTISTMGYRQPGATAQLDLILLAIRQVRGIFSSMSENRETLQCGETISEYIV